VAGARRRDAPIKTTYSKGPVVGEQGALDGNGWGGKAASARSSLAQGYRAKGGVGHLLQG
jgi:hypothetical protein